MKTLKEKAADAIVTLHSLIMDVNDYNEFPAILESVVKRIFHID